MQGQAAWRVERGGGDIGQPGLDQPVGHQAAQVVGGARLHPGGDLLGEQLDQQVGHQRSLSGGSGQPSGAALPSNTISPQALICCQDTARPSGMTATMRSMP